ncbi:hypothetical protein Ahy_A01g000502 [Arachis hypogaea]|uniref:Uncharacterized protein n=1 Tax=Arachis hypogaea TaxID=3818 RepID=A0A445EKN6_ARAHY|nr:hypothetical protein Ahy_A01g000502 [Arachis hypogaea]
MRTLDLETMHAPEFSKYASMGEGNVALEDSEFSVGIEFGSRESRWVLAFNGSHCWGHMTTNLVECINSVLKGARNLPVTAIVRSTFYGLNELFTRNRPRLMSVSATDSRIQNLLPKALKKAFDVQETLSSIGLIGARDV